MMKKINVLATFIFAVLMVSCSSDDSEPNTSSSELVGVWVGQTIDYTGTTETEVAGELVTSDFTGEGYDVDYTLTITEDPNTIVSEGTYSVELTSTVLGQTTTQNEEDLIFDETSTWSLDGTELSITTDGETSIGTITELTDESLTVTTSQIIDLSQQGTIITATTDIVTTYTRQ